MRIIHFSQMFSLFIQLAVIPTFWKKHSVNDGRSLLALLKKKKKKRTTLQTTVRPVFFLISILALGRPVLVTVSEVNEDVLETIKPSTCKTGTANGKKRSCGIQVEYPSFSPNSERCS